MAADSTRPPHDERSPAENGGLAADGTAAGHGGGETLAEKIRRYRQPGPASGGAPVSGSRVVRSPRQE